MGSKQVGLGIPQLQWATPTSTTAITLSPTHGQITQTYKISGINIVFDCTLNNTDLNFTAHVTNAGTHTSSPIVLVMPAFTFAGTPTGTMPSWHVSYIGQQGLNVYHPSIGSPLGCVYAGDASYALAAWSPSEITRPSLIQAAWVSNSGLPNPLSVELHTMDTLAAGASTDISLVLRVTTDQAPSGILSGYKALLPPMSYTPVNKPATAFQSVDSTWVNAINPLGYNLTFRRIDTLRGAAAYVSTVTPMLSSSGGMGVIFWAPGGYQPSFYPVDFDVNLNRIATTWPTVVNGLQGAGCRVGICARLGDALNADGSSRRADPTNPIDVSTMLARVDAVAKTGVDLWYIDSSCGENDSTLMTSIAKKHLPANHLFYTEYATDISLSFAGAYCEWMGQSTRWLTELQRTHLLELYPNSNWLCMDKSGKATPAKLVTLGFQPLTGD